MEKWVRIKEYHWNSIASDLLWIWMKIWNVIIEVKNKIKNLLFKK
jgi:hypothetical protein